MTSAAFNANLNIKLEDSETVTPPEEHKGITLQAVCRALRTECSPKSGWVRESGSQRIVIPRSAWLAEDQMWIDRNGWSVSGYPHDGPYQVRYFNFIEAFFVRRAFRKWIYGRGLRL